MILKKICEKLVEKHSQEFKQLLNIKSKINFHVYSSSSKKFKKQGIDYGNNKGISFINNDHAADIIIYYDKQENERDAVGTIFHELLHVRMAKLTGLITINMHKGNREEEKVVLDLEKAFMEVYK